MSSTHPGGGAKLAFTQVNFEWPLIRALTNKSHRSKDRNGAGAAGPISGPQWDQ